MKERDIQESLTAVLTHPDPQAVWTLRSSLLAAQLPADSAIWPILDHFYVFLSSLSASADAHTYSKIASLMDMGAVGGVALENVLESESNESLWKKFLAGSISEGLMVMASCQYIKAFQAEMATVYQSAAWFLYGALWQLSSQTQPELAPDVRRQLVDGLLAPIHDDAVPEAVKIGLNGRLFQILLIQHLSLSAGQLIGV